MRLWILSLLLLASLIWIPSSYAAVSLDLSRPSKANVLLIKYDIVKQTPTSMTVDITVDNGRSAWYYVDVKQRPGSLGLPEWFTLGPFHARTFKNITFVPSQGAGLVADGTLNHREVAWALAIDGLYRIVLGKEMPSELSQSLDDTLDLLAKIDAGHGNFPTDKLRDGQHLLEGLRSFTAAFKKKDIGSAARALQDIASNGLILDMLEKVNSNLAKQYATRVKGLSAVKFLWNAGQVISLEITTLLSPHDDVATIDSTFVGSKPKLQLTDVSIREGNANKVLTLQVKLSSLWWQPISVSYLTLDGTAKAKQDYISAKNTLVFAPEEKVKSISLTIVGDTINEPDESFSVRFSTTSKSLVLSKTDAIITLLNDDAAPTPTPTVTPIPTPDPSSTGKVVFASDYPSSGQYSNIYVANADSTNFKQLTTGGYDWVPRFNRSGSQVVFGSGRDGNWEIYRIDADGSNEKRLTDDASFDGNPDFSPDGSRVVFISDRTGHPEVWTMDSNGGSLFQVTSVQEEADWPRWSPDGSTIIYRDGPQIYAVSSDGARRSLVQGYYPSLSADGKTLLYAYASIYSVPVAGGSRTEVIPYSPDLSYYGLTDPVYGASTSVVFYTATPGNASTALGTIYRYDATTGRNVAFAYGCQPSWAPGKVSSTQRALSESNQKPSAGTS